MAVQKLSNDIVEAAKTSTPETSKVSNCEITYHMEIKDLVQQKCKARRTWHRTSHPTDKTKWKRINKTDYSFWKATRHMKIPRVHVPPISKECACSGQDKAETYARHLTEVFKPNDITSELDLIQRQPPDEHGEKIRYFSPLEVAHEIDININP
ncbi:Hypothetical protein CINCED_3A020647 [Cinara cedri]|uniref:Uncharacterized protein n=1 Tax=Cinara cedri TaxID=506608 RepID=A0A5E4MRC3_9HEMI|nr:Hypothetical protein CINCED_3A020647 [Cinara cedri]